MFGLFQLFFKTPILKQLPLKRYLIDFSLDRLLYGVDNIHIDVHVSSQVHHAVKRVASLLMVKHSQSAEYSSEYKEELCENEKKALKNICKDVLQDGINRAKAEDEVQIDYLGQAALSKVFLEEIKNQFDKLITHFDNIIRTCELSRRYDQSISYKIKEKLAEIKLNRNRIVRLAGKELFQILADIHANGLRNIREANFRSEHILPDHFFVNPTLHTDNTADDYFLIEEYVLFGQRSEDTDNYNNLKSIIYNLLSKTDLAAKSSGNAYSLGNKNTDGLKESRAKTAPGLFDLWIMEESNIERMLNYFDSWERYQKSKKWKIAKDNLREFKMEMNIQKSLLNLFYRKFKQLQLLKGVVAAYEMKSVYSDYCPPLVPMNIREFLIKSSSRRAIVRQLKRQKTVNGIAFNLSPLYKTVRRVNISSTRRKKEHLLNFLKQFFRYHRDLNNCRILYEAMDAINIVREEKILILSRENRSLYEFLLPTERVKEEKPIINHVIIKADIRGSIDINHIMTARGLNPASYFSLNFFDPISEVLFDYDASKVFIEGDAIILSILENEGSAQGWYSVSRACGLAIRILQIVQRYNQKNKENNLPILELGIGICYSEGPPAFLFDGDSRIMISPAINLADRLSSCSRKLRKRMQARDEKFNLFVFQNAPEKESEDTADDLSLRYNVNGIELDADGFVRLCREINIKSISYPSGKNKKIKLHAGKVPTLSGEYQYLVIREAPIMEIKPDSLDVIKETSRKYYEVCTDPEIYEFAKKQLNGK
jgi:hypothetical protein